MQLVHLLPVILFLQKQFPLESQVVEFLDPLTLQTQLKFIMGIDVEIIVVFLYISANSRYLYAKINWNPNTMLYLQIMCTIC